MSENDYIGYIIAPAPRKGILHDPRVQQSIEMQKAMIDQFMQNSNDSSDPVKKNLLETFIEKGEKKRNRKSWPALTEAVALATKKKSKLLIAQLRNNTNNPTFISLLKKDSIEFFCCDQPLVNKQTLQTVSEFERMRRELHGELIKRGLKETDKRSGNPKAPEVIGKVNKPKIERAIIFALLLQPIIKQFNSKGYSQRKMVKALNDMNFSAPEGGKWVLSQLQKVLDRIKLNELALELQITFLEFVEEELTPQQMADELNKLGIQTIKRQQWDEKQVNKVISRIKEIYNITFFNEYAIQLLPEINSSREKGLSDADIIENMIQNKTMIPTSVLDEIA